MMGACRSLWEERARAGRAAPLGVVAGTLPMGLGRAFGALPGPNDGVVCVEETSVDGMAGRALVARATACWLCRGRSESGRALPRVRTVRMRFWVALLVLAVVAGCQSLAYYTQAIGGHFKVLASARPVSDWLTDPATPPELKRAPRDRAPHPRVRLEQPRAAGQRQLSSYADIDRPYVVWNVFAARALGGAEGRMLPFAGCVSYRGFYSEDEARRHAEKLRADGYDVHVGGVPAYSTLGWSDDPLLSTFIRYPDAQLARLVFHELAHQVVYARNDTTFNESFAVTVEEEVCGAGSSPKTVPASWRRSVPSRRASAISPSA